MAIDVSTISVAPQASHVGSCDLCARGSVELASVVTVAHSTGASVSFIGCTYCQRAVHRLLATSGHLVRLVTPPTPAVAVANGSTVVATSPTPAAQAAPAAVVEPAAVAEPAVELAGELIYEYADPLQGSDGTLYLPRVYGAQRTDGTWIGWIEFGAIGSSAVLRTNRETSQPNRAALAYWGTRLQPSYLEGAFRRAVRPHFVRIA